MSVLATPAVLLRGHDYSETSRILRFYTRERGLLSVMARGVRGRSGKGTTAVATFASGTLQAWVKPNRDLHTMRDFACTRLRSGLGRDVLRFAGAAAYGDLIVAHADEEAQAPVYAALEHALDTLEDCPPERVPVACLAGLWTLVAAFGFHPELDGCVRCGRPLEADEMGRFDFAAGGMRCAACAVDAAGPRLGPLARGQVAGLLGAGDPGPLGQPRAHLAILADFVAWHVVSRPLRSFEFLAAQMPEDAPVGAGPAHVEP